MAYGRSWPRGVTFMLRPELPPPHLVRPPRHWLSSRFSLAVLIVVVGRGSLGSIPRCDLRALAIFASVNIPWPFNSLADLLVKIRKSNLFTGLPHKLYKKVSHSRKLNSMKLLFRVGKVLLNLHSKVSCRKAKNLRFNGERCPH